MNSKILFLLFTLPIVGCGSDNLATPGSDAGNGGSSDGGRNGGSVDAGMDAGLGTPLPIAASDEGKWIWESLPEMRCADDSPAGLFVNVTSKSKNLVLFFEGGGDCWNNLTCSNNLAINLHGLGPNPLATFSPDGVHAQSGIFDRSDATNPFGSDSFVVVPYCTGDSHIGNAVTTYSPGQVIHHVGYANVTKALQRIVPTFPDAPRVTVAGFSAGGMGAAGNYHQVAETFAKVGVKSVMLVDDAGPIMRPPYLTLPAEAMLRASWGLDKTIEPWCSACQADGYHFAFKAMIADQPNFRGAFVSSYQDASVRQLYGFLDGQLAPLDPSFYQAGLNDFADWTEGPEAALSPGILRVFFYGGDRHGSIETVPLSATPGLAEFLTAEVEGNPTWASVRP